MNSVTDLVVVVLLLGLVAILVTGWLVWTAGRLDRQHLRLEAARASLDTQLARRSALAAELASSGLVDPASALLLLDASASTRDPAAGERWQAESDLTDVLRRVEIPDSSAEAVVTELADASRRVAMARRIHNDLAVATRALHDRRRVRWFRLAGHAERPALVEFDDRPPH